MSNAESDFEVELTIYPGRTEPYNIGDGYGRVAVSIDDVDAEHARLRASGLSPRKLVDFAPGDKVIARLFFIADPGGSKIEVVQRGGRYL